MSFDSLFTALEFAAHKINGSGSSLYVVTRFKTPRPGYTQITHHVETERPRIRPGTGVLAYTIVDAVTFTSWSIAARLVEDQMTAARTTLEALKSL
jgi:hypothetical protein